MTKALYVVASSLGIGLVWFFAAVALLDQVFAVALTDTVLAVLLVSCLGGGAMAGWSLFVSPKGHQ